MISGQRRPSPPRNRYGRMCAVLVALWGSTTVPALAQPRSRQLVLVQPENSELITRVEGQTRDLGVTLQVAPRGWARGTAEQAAEIATERSADFVARVQRSGKGVLEVRIYAAGTRTLRARRVPHAKSERLGTSAELEAAALVLRGELSSLIEAEREAAAAREAPAPEGGSGGSGAPPGAAGGAAGTGTSTEGRSSSQRRTDETKPARAAAEPKPDERDSDRTSDEASEEPIDEEPDEEHEAEEEEEDEEPSAPLESYTVRRSAWTLRGGARGSIPLESHVAGSIVLGARAPLAFLEVGLALSTAVPFEIPHETARITLWRSALTAEALAVIPAGPRLRALLGVDLGVVLYARSTDQVDPAFRASAAKPSWAATLGAQAELQWLLTRQFGVALGLGLAYLPQQTRFAYTDNPSQPREIIAELRRFEPHATVGLFGLFGD
jgi:hypothetical protein